MRELLEMQQKRGQFLGRSKREAAKWEKLKAKFPHGGRYAAVFRREEDRRTKRGRAIEEDMAPLQRTQ